MKHKKLFIVSTKFNIDDSRFQNEKCDLLVIPIYLQYFFARKNIKFLTIEDFYHSEYDSEELYAFLKELKDWMRINDNIILKDNGIENTFTDNGFWFTHRFSELIFIQSIVRQISSKYEKIEIITDSPLSNLIHIESSFNDPSFGNIFGPQYNRILNILLVALPNIKVTYIKNKFDFSYFIQQKINFIYWFVTAIRRKGLNTFQKFLIHHTKKKKYFWTVHNGYDLDLIEPHIKNYKITNIREQLYLHNAELNRSPEQKINPKIFENNSNFIKKTLPYFKTLLGSILDNYTKSVLEFNRTINRFLEYQKNKQSIDGVIFPMCAQDFTETKIARFANKNNIPVYYFKHNGPIENFKENDFLIEYSEYVNNISRTQFIQTKNENDYFKKYKNIKTTFSIPFKIREFINNGSKINFKSILYSFGSPSHYSLKEINAISFDSEKIFFLLELLNLADKYNFEVHVKPHPRGQIEIIKLLCQIKKIKKKMKILYQGDIEKRFSNYSIIISDTLYSSVVSNAIYSNLEIITFCGRKSCIKHNMHTLIEERLVLIHKKEDLEEKLINIFNNKSTADKYKKFKENFLNFSTKNNYIEKVIKSFEIN